MRRNRCSWRPSAALLGVSILVLVLAQGTWAQSNYKTLHRFTLDRGGWAPASNLIFDAKGSLYGTTTGVPGAVFRLTPHADGRWTETVLVSFCERCSEGEYPQAGLIFDHAGNLYGTTEAGGEGDCSGLGCGVVFTLTPHADGRWTETVLYSFCSMTNCVDGASPSASLIFDDAGNLYGTTVDGGAAGLGTVFKLTPSSHGRWSESVLYSFCSLTKCRDGENPYANLIFDRAGNLYGTTQEGGSTACGSCGVVFKLSQTETGRWGEQVIHQFIGKDGSGPSAGLIFDSSGNLYGTTQAGGAYNNGTVFTLMPNAAGGWTHEVIHEFSEFENGAGPYAGVVLDAVGNLYGTTIGGGNLSACNCGVVFKLTPDSNGRWNETVLHRFLDNPSGYPYAGFISDAAGNLYGTTQGDGGTTFGSVFEMTP